MKALVVCGALAASFLVQGEVFSFKAHETLTPVELNVDDSVRFTLLNGETRTLTLKGTEVGILENVPTLEGLVYTFTVHVTVDGHPLALRRYAPTQESFYEPVVVNGMRIWPDMVLKLFDHVPMRYPHMGNRRQRPWKDARFALQDATLPICPEPLHPWYDNQEGVIPVGRCYHGGDVWMGPFGWGACHGGLDICHKRGDVLYAPFSVDDQWYFNSLRKKDNNNRWRGIRRWPDGALWAIQTHHLIDLKVDEHTPVKKGTPYATTAGVAVGWYDHTHFEFKVASERGGKIPDFDQGPLVDDPSGAPTGCRGQPEVHHLDPWILFWQIFKQQKADAGRPDVDIAPFSPVQTGASVPFAAVVPPVVSTNAAAWRFNWAFGDGSRAEGASVRHAFMKPGIYPVTLTLERGETRLSATQHITVDGAAMARPALAFASEDLAFHPQPVGLLDAYGRKVERIPFAPRFIGDHSRTNYRDGCAVQLVNRGGGVLPAVAVGDIVYTGPAMPKWLTAEVTGAPGEQTLVLRTMSRGIHRGTWRADVTLRVPGAQEETVVLPVSYTVMNLVAQKGRFSMDDDKPGVFLTPGFWVGHRLIGRHGLDYRTNGGRSEKGQFVRFEPRLAAGTWKIVVPLRTPSAPGVRYWVRVVCADGERRVSVEPLRNPVVGTFDFDFCEGFVEILAEDSVGLVAVNMLEFIPVRLK